MPKEDARPDMFFAAVEMSGLPMCLTDPRRHDNPIIFCNRAYEQLTGYGKDEVLGRNCRFLQGKDTNPETVALIRNGLTSGRDIHHELLNYRKDGSSFWCGVFISPVLDADGNLIYYFGSQLDVTQRREAEAALRQTRRMEALSGMASGLAHEFNNLLTIVLAGLEQAEDEPNAERRAKQIGRAKWGAERAAKLTDQILSFSRQQYHNSQTVDVNEILQNCDKVLDQMGGVDVRVVLELGDELLPVRLDSGQLELALLNLVRNAADATPKGGTVIVSTRLRQDHAGAEGTEAEIAVIDQGCGMPTEVTRRSIEPFFTTKEPGKGTGLGLSMVNGFAEQSGGRLEIESVSGVGTTMRLVFPRASVDSL